jgi:hypothetical protein
VARFQFGELRTGACSQLFRKYERIWKYERTSNMALAVLLPLGRSCAKFHQALSA